MILEFSIIFANWTELITKLNNLAQEPVKSLLGRSVLG